MTKEQLKAKIRQTEGRFFTIRFEKKDGTITNRCAKGKNISSLRGGEDRLAGTPYVSFYDQNAKGYRCAHPDKVLLLKCGERVLYKKD